MVADEGAEPAVSGVRGLRGWMHAPTIMAMFSPNGDSNSISQRVLSIICMLIKPLHFLRAIATARPVESNSMWVDICAEVQDTIRCSHTK